MEREQDETIRELFQQLKGCDEQTVPSFASTVNPATCDLLEVQQRSLRWWPLATSIAAVLAAGFVLYDTPSWRSLPASVDTTPRILAERTLLPPARKGPTVGGVGSAIRRRRAAVRSRPLAPAAVIAKWRSPTEFLLPPQDDSVLRNYPRLDESLIKIRRPQLPGSAN